MDLRILAILGGAALLSFTVSALSGRWLIPWLHKLHFGQTIREVGPAWHKKKQGTPTMGGFLFLLGALAALAVMVPVCLLLGGADSFFGSNAAVTRFVAGLLLILCCGAIGFADDYIKVIKKRNLGLTGPQKLFLQILVAAGYITSLYLCGDRMVWVPFAGEVDFGWWFFPFGLFIVVGTTNAVNLTDGVDGLCGSVTFLALLTPMILSGWLYNTSQGLIAAAVAGGILGFLVWNLHPAKVFMGDLGSLALGGALCAVTFGLRRPLLLIPIGVIYILETLSVILQVIYFKLTHGKRLFKMSPIHHHFEMCGWSENKIVTVFSLVTAAGCVAAFLFEMLTRV